MEKSDRFEIFIHALKSSTVTPHTREEAFDLIKSTLDAVEDEHTEFPASDYENRMHAFPMESFYSWKNLTGDPASWTDSIRPKHRTDLYNNGTIVITEIQTGNIILKKP